MNFNGKILVIQLARLGDIYMTWPALRALRRKYADAEIHVLCRSRFRGALEGLEVVDKIVDLPTRAFLEPLVVEGADSLCELLAESLNRVGSFLESLQSQSYDIVINASFSEVSSHLAWTLEGQGAQIRGWTRASLEMLHFPEEVSAYFTAQVGIGRPNRVHMVDLFSALFDVELQDSDFAPPTLPDLVPVMPAGSKRTLTVHVGASENHKVISPLVLGRMICSLLKSDSSLQVVLIGSFNEQHLAQEICFHASGGQDPDLVDGVIDLVGKTTLTQTFAVLTKSVALIGGDSAPMHMAAFTKTKCLCISPTSVSFWETGPIASGSAVLPAKVVEDCSSEELAGRVLAFLADEKSEDLIYSQNMIPRFAAQLTAGEDFCWELVNAIYFDGPFPICEEMQIVEGVDKLFEILHLLQEHLKINKLTPSIWSAETMRGSLEAIAAVARAVPQLAGLLNWFLAEHYRIVALPQPQYLNSLRDLLQAFAKLLNIYHLKDEMGQVG